MNKFILSSVAAAGLLVGSAALAGGTESLPVSNDAGFYVGGMLGWGKTSVQLQDNSGNDLDTDNSGFSWGLDLGYQFNPYFAVEFGFTDFPNVALKYNNPDVTQTVSKSNHMFDVAAKGILPLNNGFSLFAKLGLAYVHTDVLNVGNFANSYNQIAPLVGAGVGYAVGHGVTVDVQTQVTPKTGDIPSMYGVYAGLNYKIPTV